MSILHFVRDMMNGIRNVWMFRFRYRWISCGQHVHCQASTRFWSPRKYIRIGHHVGIGYNCLFQADTEIGDYVAIASYVAFLNSDDHRFDIVGKTIWESGRGDRFKIVIEDDVWIGHGAIILSPTVIGRGAIVAAGSIVTKDVPQYAIVAGSPARVLRMRFSPEQIAEHERLLGLG